MNKSNKSNHRKPDAYFLLKTQFKTAVRNNSQSIQPIDDELVTANQPNQHYRNVRKRLINNELTDIEPISRTSSQRAKIVNQPEF